MRTTGAFMLGLIVQLFVLCSPSAVLRAQEAPPTLPDGFKVGDAAPNVRLMGVDDRYLSFDDFAKVKGVIVIFTCNHCPYSIKYEDRILALDAKYAAQGYPVVAINPNDPKVEPGDSFDSMKVRAKEKAFTFPYLFDETQVVARTFGARRTPHVFVLSRQPKGYRVEYIGAIDDDASGKNITTRYVEKAVDALLAGTAPAESFTKAIGCTIKWKK